MKMKPQFLLIKTSTLDFIRAARKTPGYSFFDFVHGYVYARWPYLYIGIGTGEHRIAERYAQFLGTVVRWLDRWRYGNGDGSHENGNNNENAAKIRFADTYHGKVVPLESASRLVTVNEDIELHDLEPVIPYKYARDIVLNNPDHIVALDCPCRVSRADPCLPLDVCLIIGEPFASFVHEQHPQRSRWVNPQEAVVILQAEDKRGHVHHAFFKDAMLERFYAICNCCACCCGAMQAHRNGTPMLASSGYVSHLEIDLCSGCGSCADTCQFGALSVSNGYAIVDVDKCMGCGVCVEQCEQGALELQRDDSKGEPLEIIELMAAYGRDR